MILSKPDQKRYPKFAKYVRHRVPKLAHDREIVDRMHELVAISKKKVRDALKWGNAPTVLIVPDLICRVGSNAAGCFRKKNPDQIEIEGQIVQEFERKPGKMRSTERSKVPRAGIVLLHELVHWADYKVDGERTPVHAPYHDVGSKWEWLVFLEFLDEMRGD